MIKSLAIQAINYYQSKGGGLYWFNVDCCFEPSCSEYCKQAIIKHGLIRGLILFLKRFKRCNGHRGIEKKLDPL